MKIWILKLIILSFPIYLPAQQVARHITSMEGGEIGFLEARPKNYGQQKHPVIIFLHGSAERGNGKSDLEKVATHGLPKITKTKGLSVNGSDFIVLSPQLDNRFGDWQFFYIDEMLKYANSLSIDTNRIYLTGVSLGGGGVLAYSSASVENAKRFAAIVPVCAVCFYDFKKLVNIANAALPVWGFTGASDKVVSPICTTQAVDAVNAATPSIRARKTIYKGVGHNAWDRAYDPTHKYQSPNVYEWMLRFRKK